LAITTLQRTKRADAIGSSDAAAILGFSPWQNAADVQLRKLGLVDDEPTSELAEIGTALEAGIADLAGKRLGVKLVKPNATFVHPAADCLRANVDRQVERFGRGQPIVETKDSGLDVDWGEPGSDQVPAYVTCQVVFQMMVSDAPVAHVARLGRGFNRGLFLYRLEQTDGVKRLIGTMEAYLPSWWRRHIVNQDPIPDDQPPPSLALLRRLRREPNTWAEVPGDLYLDASRKREAKLQAEKDYELAQARLIAAMRLELEDPAFADACTCEHGTATFFEQTAERIDTTRLRAEADIAGKFIKPSTTRVLRFKPAK
jgi:putative phage-type endonuclease